MRPTASIILVMIVVSVLVTPTSASDVTITVDNQQVRAKFVLSFHQNMTQLPNQTSTLDIASDANLSSSLTKALKKVDPAASSSDASLNVDSSATWMNLTAAMTILGVTKRQGDILAVNTTWRTFNVSSDLRAGNLSYNAVGTRYLLPVVKHYVNASRFVSRPNATITGVIFFVNGTSIGPSSTENYVGNFTLLDFRALEVPLDGWTKTYSLSNNTTTWRYSPSARMDLSIGVQHLNVTKNLFASFAYSAEVAISGMARVQGNTLFVDVGTGQKEQIMTGIVVLAVALAIMAQLVFRARKKKYLKSGRW